MFEVGVFAASQNATIILPSSWCQSLDVDHDDLQYIRKATFKVCFFILIRSFDKMMRIRGNSHPESHSNNSEV